MSKYRVSTSLYRIHLFYANITKKNIALPKNFTDSKTD